MARGENIYKRKDGRWEGRYVRSYSSDGTIRYGYVYSRSYREVREKLFKAKSDLKADILPEASILRKKKFSFFAENWLQTHRDKLKESTYAKYATMLEKHILPFLGSRIISSIDTALISAFSSKLLHEDHLSVKTVKDILSVLHSILSSIQEDYYETMKPVKIIYPKGMSKELRVLSKEEHQLLLSEIQNDTDCYKLAILLSLTTGLRIGEICGLRWCDISLAQRELHVRNTVQRIRNFKSDQPGKTRLMIGPPKTATSLRTIPLNDGILHQLSSFADRNEACYILTGTELFMDPRKLQRHCHKITEQLGMKDIHFHTFRHTFATRCVEIGTDIKTLSEILGHASTAITMDRYVHPSMELKRISLSRLDSAGFGCLPSSTPSDKEK